MRIRRKVVGAKVTVMTEGLLGFCGWKVGNQLWLG
jgi:hypothetical protein